MKPHKTPKGKRAAQGAARTYVRVHLGWLRGFPAWRPGDSELVWMTQPRLGSRTRPEQLIVTRERLRRMTFGRNAARRKFPIALAGVVGDVDVWSDRIDTQLGLLKSAVHDGKALPKLEELLRLAGHRRSSREWLTRLARRHPPLEPMITALVWIYWHDAAALLQFVGVLEPFASQFTRLLDRLEPPQGLVHALRCGQIIADGSDPAFLSLLADDRAWTVPLVHDSFAKRLCRQLKSKTIDEAGELSLVQQGFERPQAKFADDLLLFVTDLTVHDKTDRNRQLILLKSLMPGAVLSQWDAWWRLADQAERDARRLLGDPRLMRKKEKARRELAAQIADALDPPRAFRLPALRDLIEAITSAASPKAFEALNACLDQLPGQHDGKPIAQTFIEHWVGEFRQPNRQWGVIVRLLKALSNTLRQMSAPDDEMQTWIAQHLSDNLSYFWIDRAKPQRLIEPALESLRLVYDRVHDSAKFIELFRHYAAWDSLVEVVDLTGSPETAAEIFLKAQPDMSGVYGKAWSALLRLGQLDPNRFEAIAVAWQPDHWSEQLVEELAVLTADTRVADLLADGIVAGDGKRISRLVALFCLNRSLGLALDAPPAMEQVEPIEMTPYPEELHSLLETLQAHDEHAGRAVRQILSRDFPRREQLESELANLRDRLVRSGEARRQALQARITALEARIEQPAEVSEQRRNNLRTKLERRILHARLSRWEQLLSRQAKVWLEDVLGHAPSEDYLDFAEIMPLITALAGLSSGFRRLGLRLVRERFGPEPWDLRSEPENHWFSEMLEQRGLLLRPWLDGICAHEVTIGGKSLTLALEEDPLEVMRMGEPFDTCLSPGAFNFFSAVANAADINKRVLYVRDAKGTIQARCLLALTDQGQLLTFFLYAHVQFNALTEAVRAFVKELADAMGTVVASQGHVRKLVASDWYDDGPHDLTGQLRFLQTDTEFMNSLSTMTPADLVPALKAELGHSTISPYVASMLAQTQSFQQRPELIRELLPSFGDPGLLDPWTCLTLVGLLRQVDEHQRALDVLRRLSQTVLSQRFEYDRIQVRVAEELIALGQPHKALQLIRRTRPQYVRDWADEWEPRIMVAARALQDLYRPRRALDLYRNAGRNGSKDARKHAKQLERDLGLLSART